VDDGSSDNSRSIIEGYGDRITAIFQSNSGNTGAYNTGFARTRGDVVIFLDSDDWLDSSLVKNLAEVWRPGISKVQFQMRVVDAAGRATGSFFPQYAIVPTPEQIKRWVMRSGAYPTPPGSGNAYAREFLTKIFPLDVGDRACDSQCLAAAPYLGEVVTVAKPLVAYRIHGGNQGAMAKLDVRRFRTELSRARWRFRYGQRIARSVGLEVNDDVFDKNMATLSYRLASLRLDPAEHPIGGDTPMRVLRDLVTAFFVPQGLGRRTRAVLLAWAGLVAVTPRPVSKRLVLWRFAPSNRPVAVRRVLRGLRLVKG
jgi:glycosyltransferase involved in cell wall biosynthesis